MKQMKKENNEYKNRIKPGDKLLIRQFIWVVITVVL